MTQTRFEHIVAIVCRQMELHPQMLLKTARDYAFAQLRASWAEREDYRALSLLSPREQETRWEADRDRAFGPLT